MEAIMKYIYKNKETGEKKETTKPLKGKKWILLSQWRDTQMKDYYKR